MLYALYSAQHSMASNIDDISDTVSSSNLPLCNDQSVVVAHSATKTGSSSVHIAVFAEDQVINTYIIQIIGPTLAVYFVSI